MHTMRIDENNEGHYGGTKFKARVQKHKNVNKSMGVFTPALRWISRDRSIAIIERPPSIMQIRYSNMMKYEALRRQNATHYSIPWPWTQYKIGLYNGGGSIASISYSVSAKPISSPNDTVYYFSLPNSSQGNGKQFWTCASTEKPDTTKMALSEAFVAGINSLWLSGFNNNAGSGTPSFNSKTIPTKYAHLAKSSSSHRWDTFLRDLEQLNIDDVLRIVPHLTVKTTFREFCASMDEATQTHKQLPQFFRNFIT